MFIYGGIKAYQRRKEKKAMEAAGLDPKDKDDRPICPQCQEKHKIQFAKRDEGGVQATWAKCDKCGNEWRFK